MSGLGELLLALSVLTLVIGDTLLTLQGVGNPNLVETGGVFSKFGFTADVILLAGLVKLFSVFIADFASRFFFSEEHRIAVLGLLSGVGITVNYLNLRVLGWFA